MPQQRAARQGVPANRDLEWVDGELLKVHRLTDYRDCLRRPIEKVVATGYWDFVFLDTAPNISTPTAAAYRVAEWFILTATPERLAIEGLNDAMSDIDTVRRYNNPNLRLLGVVLSCVNRRTRLAVEILGWVEQTFRDAGRFGDFKTQISRSVAVPDAQQVGNTIFQTEPGHKVAEEYPSLPGSFYSDCSMPRDRAQKMPRVKRQVEENAQAAGVDHLIKFIECDFRQTPIPLEPGHILLNPEYGERMGDEAELEGVDMAKRRDRPAVNPLLKDRVDAIVGIPETPSTVSKGMDQGRGHANPHQRHPAVHGPAHRRVERERVAVQIKARFSKREAEEVDRFTRTLSSYLRTTVKGSEITRALWTLVIRSGDGLADLAGRAPTLDRPSYGDRLAMAEYEDAIAEFLLVVLKSTR